MGRFRPPTVIFPASAFRKFGTTPGIAAIAIMKFTREPGVSSVQVWAVRTEISLDVSINPLKIFGISTQSHRTQVSALGLQSEWVFGDSSGGQIRENT